MYTNVNPIYANKPRQPETADTRLGIGKHEKDQGRKKDDEKENKDPFSADDTATVSVEALKVFLENFLKSQNQEAVRQKEAQQLELLLGPQKNANAPIINPQAAQAAHAYQNAARTKKSTTAPVQNSAREVPLLESTDVRKIHVLLDELKTLTANNVGYLNIERSDTFLNSLTEAVEKAKTV